MNTKQLAISLVIAAFSTMAAQAADQVTFGANYIGWAGPGPAQLRHRVMIIRLADVGTNPALTQVAVLADDNDPHGPSDPILVTHVEFETHEAPGQRVAVKPLATVPFTPRFAVATLPHSIDPNLTVRLYTSGGLVPHPEVQVLLPHLTAALALADIRKLPVIVPTDPSLNRTNPSGIVLKSGQSYTITGTAHLGAGPEVVRLDFVELTDVFVTAPSASEPAMKVERFCLVPGTAISAVAMAEIMSRPVRAQVVGTYLYDTASHNHLLKVTSYKKLD